MAFYEYKNHLIDGTVVAPSFVTLGPYWTDPIQQTHVTWIPDDRNYWIPDTLVQLDVAVLRDRVLHIHSITPFTKYDMQTAETMVMTNSEVIAMFEKFLEQFV